MAERLRVFSRDDGAWCVAFDGRVLVTFFGARAQQMAVQEQKELTDLLDPPIDGAENESPLANPH